MGNLQDLSCVLTSIAGLRTDEAIDYCLAGRDDAPSPYLTSLLAFSYFHDRQFERATVAAAAALDEASDDPDALMLARAMSGLVAAAWPVTVTEADRQDALVSALRDLHSIDRIDHDCRAFIMYLLAEAAIACARLDLAAQFVERTGPIPASFLAKDGRPNPYLTVMYVMRMRVLGFQGKSSEALALGDAALAAPTSPTMRLLLDATICFLRGNAAEHEAVQQLADRLERRLPQPIDYISTGCFLLVAYGLIAAGDVPRAAQFVLLAGTNAGLEGLNIIDRALGLELLTASAAGAGDLDAAEAWRDQAEVLLSHPVARPTIERLFSRVELLAGHAVESAAWAQLAIEHAVVDGRTVEAAEGEILLSQARLALADSGHDDQTLDGMIAAVLDTALFATRRAAASQLRAAGRRLKPHSGSGWDGLSSREREVARLITEGMGNQEIAGRLHLSPHTVRAHVSRVLAAFGVASRFAVAARLSEVMPVAAVEGSETPLTPRQEAVVDRIVLGRSNDEIARELGISIKTVEKHVSEILRRWGVTSRIGIARLALSHEDDAPA